MIAKLVVGVIVGLMVMLALEPLAREHRRTRETDEQILARRRREKALRLVNDAYDNEQRHWWN